MLYLKAAQRLTPPRSCLEPEDHRADSRVALAPHRDIEEAVSDHCIRLVLPVLELRLVPLLEGGRADADHVRDGLVREAVALHELHLPARVAGGDVVGGVAGIDSRRFYRDLPVLHGLRVVGRRRQLALDVLPARCLFGQRHSKRHTSHDATLLLVSESAVTQSSSPARTRTAREAYTSCCPLRMGITTSASTSLKSRPGANSLKRS